jgi:hypothetical protein
MENTLNAPIEIWATGEDRRNMNEAPTATFRKPSVHTVRLKVLRQGG